MFWWWERLDEQDVYKHYKPLSGFLSGISLAGLKTTTAKTSNDRLRVLGYQDKDRAYFWLSDKQATWWSQVVDKKKPDSIEGATIEITGLKPGRYSVEWWDTIESKTVGRMSISLSGNTVSVSVPTFRSDVACKVVRTDEQ